MDWTDAAKEELLDAARAVIVAVVTGEPAASAPTTNPALMRPGGCFVSLHERATHALRGCIGRFGADGAILDAVREMAAAVLEDSRFAHRRLRSGDMGNLDLEISVLSPLRPIAGPGSFEPLVEGIYVEIQGRTGCFLPQVARDTGWGREQLLNRLCSEKLGIEADAWRRTEARFWTFTVDIMGPAALVIA